MNLLQSTANSGGDLGAACCSLSAAVGGALPFAGACRAPPAVPGGGLAVADAGGGLAAAACPKGVIALGGGFAAGLPSALACGEAALGILLADFATGAALSFGPADEDRGDLKGRALSFAPLARWSGLCAYCWSRSEMLEVDLHPAFLSLHPQDSGFSATAVRFLQRGLSQPLTLLLKMR